MTEPLFRTWEQALDWYKERVAQLEAALHALATAAVAYDAAIIKRAPEGNSWVEGDDLDELYETWISLARDALGMKEPE
jgi:hypothetical protein